MFSSWIARWTCPRARACPEVLVPLAAELHVDPLQGPQGLAHPGVGLGLGHGLAPAHRAAEPFCRRPVASPWPGRCSCRTRNPRRCRPSTGARAGGWPSRSRASPGRGGPGSHDRSAQGSRARTAAARRSRGCCPGTYRSRSALRNSGCGSRDRSRRPGRAGAVTVP